MLAAGLCWCGGCERDARLAGREIPELLVRTVRDQGVELGPETAPQEVVFVLLRAIRDDVLAGPDREARRRALERQFAVCDPDYIHDWYRRTYGRRAVATREEWVFKRVSLWAPALAHYVDSFDFDLQTARSRMRTGPTSEGERWPGETRLVDLPVQDPAGEEGGDVLVRVRLHRHSLGYWRVFQVGFTKQRRPAASESGPKPSAAQSQPAS
jgi:hypothetical protein